MINIIINEWKGLFRNKIFFILSLFFFISLIICSLFGNIQNNEQNLAQKKAQEHIRLQWDEMEPSNPHSAAHYGTYAFKPVSILNSLDEGINSVTGNVLRLEGHRQNNMVFSEVSQSLQVSNFGKLNPALIFQIIIPLFLIFLSFNSYALEKSSGRIKLLLIQGVSLGRIIFSKILSLWLIAIFLLITTIIIQIVFNKSQFDLDTLFRLSLFFVSYSFYFYVIVGLTFIFSIVAKNNTWALSLTILIWISWTTFLPSVIVNISDEIIPLTTRIEFNKSLSKDRSKGIDGHNPRGDRKEALENATLKKYNVEKIEDLPVNFSGILMQADEEYGNMVWDKHFGNLCNQLKAQKFFYQISGVVNPFISLQNLSMGVSGTDIHHHIDFLNHAEKYRRLFIKSLNDEYAFGGSKTGERGWKATNDFFRSIKKFQYHPPNFYSFHSKYIIDFLVLSFWVLSIITIIYFITRKKLVL